MLTIRATGRRAGRRQSTYRTKKLRSCICVCEDTKLAMAYLPRGTKTVEPQTLRTLRARQTRAARGA
jgi:hypothetical protein